MLQLISKVEETIIA